MPFKFKDEFKSNAHGLLAVSIGQKNQTGERFIEEVEAVLDCPQLSKVSVFLADSLQRFHYMAREGLTEEEALEKAMTVADEWQRDNQEALIALKQKGGKIYSYNDFLIPSEVQRNQVLDFYSSNTLFKKKVDGIAGNFTRKIRKEIKMEGKKVNDVCWAMRNFILEESGIFIYLSLHEDNFEYVLYPGNLPSPVKYVYQQFIDNKYAVHVPLVYYQPEETAKTDFWHKPKKTSDNFENLQNTRKNIQDTNLDDSSVIALINICYKYAEKKNIGDKYLDEEEKNIIESAFKDMITLMTEVSEKILQIEEKIEEMPQKRNPTY